MTFLSIQFRRRAERHFAKPPERYVQVVGNTAAESD
jgi:hypothetical protein